jgi:hypothetical protein
MARPSRLNADDTAIGLISRTPSQYSEFQIQPIQKLRLRSAFRPEKIGEAARDSPPVPAATFCSEVVFGLRSTDGRFA